MSVNALRRGLPRISGGSPWPDGLPVTSSKKNDQPAGNEDPLLLATSNVSPGPEQPTQDEKTVPGALVGDAPLEGFRRGLPRVAGGESWPHQAMSSGVLSAAAHSRLEKEASSVVPELPAQVDAAAGPTSSSPASNPDPIQSRISLKERLVLLPLTSKILLSSAAFVVLAGVIILLARVFVQIPAVESFITEFPGTTSLPATAPIGLPAWIGWQHFFNVFLMVLIIRSGITIRREKRPGAYWAPRRNPAAKVSLTVWWHQSVDTLWLINGLAFVVLLCVTGQWMRIVPTSWEVVPNAISAGIQYATLDWPTENGWVNYNSLQVLAYFTIVFVASPLAAITGYRMSGMWPERAKRLSALFRMEWARAIHFPVMIFFCGFIVIHVFLVMTTGALRNLNHMFAARDVVDWVGLWVFAGSLALIGLAWFAVRPLVLAPIARLFGSVTSR